MDKDVIIVGAGLSGLSCAKTLHENKIPFHIFEAGDDVGGRVRTDQVDGFLLDRGFQVLLTSYPEASRILDYDKLRLKTFYPGAIIRYKGEFHRIADPFKKPIDAVLSLNSPVGTLKDKFLIAFLRYRVLSQSEQSLLQGHETSTYDFLKEFGFSDKIINTFFRPFFGGVFLDSSLGTSSRLFQYLFRMFSLGYTSIPENGMEEIPRQIFSALPPGCITFNTRVEKITGGNTISLSSESELTAGYLVVATDFPGTAELVDKVKSPGSVSVKCMYYWSHIPPIRESALVLNGEGEGPVNNMCVLSNVSGRYAPKGKSLISITILEDYFTDRQDEQVIEQMERWYGAVVRNWKLIRSYTINHALPVQNAPASNFPGKPVKTNEGIFICGDVNETASIQGAMLSGRKAAEQIIRDIKNPDSEQGCTGKIF